MHSTAFRIGIAKKEATDEPARLLGMIRTIEPTNHWQEAGAGIIRPMAQPAPQEIAAGKGVATAMVRVEALPIDRENRTLVETIVVQGLMGRIPRDVLTGRALGEPAPDLKDQNLMAVDDAAVTAAPAMLDQLVHRAMANK